MSDESKKPTVFLSYAHHDGTEFTRRLSFALGFYADIYWDQRLQSGPYPEQLENEIKKRNFFVLVMSPYSLRDDGWCMREFSVAEANNKEGIVLAHIVKDESNLEREKELGNTYTYCDFRNDFDTGFRRMTYAIFNYPLNSWEYLFYRSDKELLDELEQGHLPGLIAKSIAEWVIVERVWTYFEEYVQQLERKQGTPLFIFFGKPRTPSGIWRQCDPLIQQFGRDRNQIGILLIKNIKAILDRNLKSLLEVSDENHELAGEVAKKIIGESSQFLQSMTTMDRDFLHLGNIQAFFQFDIAEKLRELISAHARRSRYLY